MRERRLLVNADDYSLTPGVSAGIREAHRSGVVTSTSVMANGQDVPGDLRLAREDCPGLGIGVHLVLTAGRPVSSPVTVRSLVDGDGAFRSYDAYPAAFDSVDLDELHLEWTTQILAVKRISGGVDHLDSHHHIAYIDHRAFGVFARLAAEHRLAVRHPSSPLDAAATWAWLRLHPLQPTLRENHRLAVRYGLRHTDRFLAAFYGAGVSVELLTGLIDSLPPGSTELMCHPAQVTPDLLMRTSYGDERAQELEILTSGAVADACARRAVTLIRYGGL